MVRMAETSRGQEQPVSPNPERKRYQKPVLSEYGSVAKLTQGTATKQSDGGGGGFRRAG
jgi:hypothetical protein